AGVATSTGKEFHAMRGVRHGGKEPLNHNGVGAGQDIGQDRVGLRVVRTSHESYSQAAVGEDRVAQHGDVAHGAKGCIEIDSCSLVAGDDVGPDGVAKAIDGEHAVSGVAQEVRAGDIGADEVVLDQVVVTFVDEDAARTAGGDHV